MSDDDTYARIRAEVDALSGDELREYLADMMGRSVAVGAVPRDVLLKRLAAVTDADLRITIVAALDTVRMMERDARGNAIAIVYDAAEVERVRKIQRDLKE